MIVNLEKIALYRSQIPSMDEGWTRWIFSNCDNTVQSPKNIENKEIISTETYRQKLQEQLFSPTNRRIKS